MKHVISRISDGKKASGIIQGVDLLQCMKWLNQAFEQIIKDAIKHCFEKRGFSEVSLLEEEPDEELGDLLKSLTIDVVPDECASFGYDVDISEIPINVQKKGWEDILHKQFIQKVNADPDEINISSDDSDLEDNDYIETMEEENLQISFPAALQILDQLQDFASSFVDTEMQCHLAAITEKLKRETTRQETSFE